MLMMVVRMKIYYSFSREVSEVVDSDQTLQVILFLKSKQKPRNETIREGYMVPTWYALADLKFVKKFTQPHSLGQKFCTLKMRTSGLFYSQQTSINISNLVLFVLKWIVTCKISIVSEKVPLGVCKVTKYIGRCYTFRQIMQ